MKIRQLHKNARRAALAILSIYIIYMVLCDRQLGSYKLKLLILYSSFVALARSSLTLIYIIWMGMGCVLCRYCVLCSSCRCLYLVSMHVFVNCIVFWYFVVLTVVVRCTALHNTVPRPTTTAVHVSQKLECLKCHLLPDEKSVKRKCERYLCTIDSAD